VTVLQECFTRFCDSFEALPFPGQGDFVPPDCEAVVAARNLLHLNLDDDGFKLGAVAAELERLREGTTGPGLKPFIRLPRTGAELSFGYWAPTATPGPHEHSAWTLTAICRNELDVVSFDREASYKAGTLQPKARFKTHSGEVGYLTKASIHAPKNASRDWTLTLHVSSPHDRPPEDHDIRLLPKLTHPAAAGMQNSAVEVCMVRARQRTQQARFLAHYLLELRNPDAAPILALCCRLSDVETEAVVRQSMPDSLPFPENQTRLVRTHPELEFSIRKGADGVALCTRTPNGEKVELIFGSEAAATVAFIMQESSFQIDKLPGGYSADERRLIVAQLERRGLLERVYE
jgi:hypothetical protein